MAKIVAIVGKPGARPVIIIDEETGRLLLFVETYGKKLEPGVYTDPEEIVDILVVVATRGHKPSVPYNPRTLYTFLEPLLLANAPLKDKATQIIKFIRSSIKV